MAEPVVSKNEAASRFELHLDGELIGLAEYYDADGVREFPHTEVNPALQGRGHAGRLVGEALKATADEGLKVEPLCPFVAGYMRRHPEYQALVTGE